MRERKNIWGETEKERERDRERGNVSEGETSYKERIKKNKMHNYGVCHITVVNILL